MAHEFHSLSAIKLGIGITMRANHLIFPLVILLASCGSTEENNATDPTNPTVPGGLPPGCFTEFGTRVNAGARACRGGKLHECQKNGEWVNLGFKC